MLRVSLPDDGDRAEVLGRLRRREAAVAPAVMEGARAAVEAVRSRGDAAVRELTLRFEGRSLEALEIDAGTWARLADETTPEVRRAIERAHQRVRHFHTCEREAMGGPPVLNEPGIQLTSRYAALRRVGVYVPGGTARYPSSVLMTAVPAKVAGVSQVVMVTPGPSAEALYAARVAGVSRVFAIGGAQAIAALAYGTESVPRVDKIVGPGNAWVTAAKRIVYGDVGIDQVAGPSEVLVLSDGHAAQASWIAADLIAQAEHDVDSWPVLFTLCADEARAVAAEVERQLSSLPRAAIARAAIERHGVAVVFDDAARLLDLSVEVMFEHVELMFTAPETVSLRTDGGAIFLGRHTSEAVGDYFAGPSHVLPTGGAARFGSPLSVHDFLRRTSILQYDEAALADQADDIIRLAEVEGLEGHARSIKVRRP